MLGSLESLGDFGVSVCPRGQEMSSFCIGPFGLARVQASKQGGCTASPHDVLVSFGVSV